MFRQSFRPSLCVALPNLTGSQYFSKCNAAFDQKNSIIQNHSKNMKPFNVKHKGEDVVQQLTYSVIGGDVEQQMTQRVKRVDNIDKNKKRK